MRLTTMGTARNFGAGSIVGVIATNVLRPDKRGSKIRLFAKGVSPGDEALSGYRAILCNEELKATSELPCIERLRETDHLKDGDIVVLGGSTGLVRSLYRPYEFHHHLFVTERCNSN